MGDRFASGIRPERIGRFALAALETFHAEYSSFAPDKTPPYVSIAPPCPDDQYLD